MSSNVAAVCAGRLLGPVRFLFRDVWAGSSGSGPLLREAVRRSGRPLDALLVAEQLVLF